MPHVRMIPLVLALVAAAAALVAPASASADRSFSARYATTDRGQVAFVANALETCPAWAPECAASQAGTAAAPDNSQFSMSYVDVDSEATTFSSSRATLALPSGATVLWAGLYWAGDTSAGLFGAAAPTPASRNQVPFATPTAGYATVTASVLDVDATTTTRFQGFADVTAQVKAAGSGTYAVGNVQSGTGMNRWAGWSLVIAYRDSAQPIRRLQVYDGFLALQSGGTASTSIALSDFFTPASGTVTGRIGLLAWEGDRNRTADTATLGTRGLSDAVNPASDFVNSTISRGGATVTTRSPAYANTMGVDADDLPIDGVLGNGAAASTLTLTATSDTYLPGAVALATDEGPPAATAAPSVTGSAVDGATLTADRGTWAGTPTIAYSYQWRRCDSAGANCADIANATSATYALTPADVGSTVRVAVTATNAAGATTASASQTARVAATPPVNTSAPSIFGTARDGQALTLDRGTWTGTPTLSYASQWRRCDAAGANCADIAGATSLTYTSSSADVGKTLRAVVTATNAAGSAGATSAQTAIVAAAPPANTIAPVISGTARDGQLLSVSQGTWTGTATIAYAYQWRRCDSAGANCASIAGATAASYALTSADVGSTLRAVVTATNAAGSATATSAATATVAAAVPANTVAPAISGTARDGQTLAVSQGTWTGSPTISYTYQWRRCDSAGANCSDIAGAISSSYALTSADVGKTLRAVVTATNAGGATAAASAATATVAALAPANDVAPSISGTARDGQTLSVDRGTWTGTPTIAYTYQWRRCDSAGANCSDIAGATATTYALTSADVGKTIRATVTATNAAGSTGAASTPTAVIAAAPPGNTAPPTIAGTARDGQALVASTGTWTGTPTISYLYQWRRCDGAGASCTDIGGATAASYTLTGADVGSTVRVRVTATNAAATATALSAATATVAATAPANAVAPSIAGTARDGQSLTLDRGTWTGTPTIAYDYRWQRCDASGANCSDIAGATATAYTLTSADVGTTIRAIVTASNDGGSTTAITATSAVVAATAPVNTTAPSISGTTRDGQTLTVDRGAWTGTPTIAYAYQWRRCDTAGATCTDIAGATASSYTLTSADVGKTIRAAVTATNAGGSTSAVTTPSATVAATGPVNTVAPAISGTARDGSTLTATTGTWSGTPTIAYAYQWRRCDATGAGCADIAGATAASYALTSADVGNTIRAAVTATNVAGSATATSATSAVVAAAAPAATAAPTVAGTARDGQTLTATTGSWTGTPTIAYAYQWRRCDTAGANCTDVASATGTSYVLTGADVGTTIRVRVTATNTGGSTSADSAATAVVAAAPPADSAPPTINGVAREGQTVTAAPGSWSGTLPITYAYQWLRCDAAGTTCSDIAGATSSRYTLVLADVSGSVKVRVTATNAGGSASATSARASVDSSAPANTSAPTVSGTARDGQTLTAADGTWSGTIPIGYAHEWLRCDPTGASCAAIAGATASTYTLTSADVGSVIRVAVTASNAAGAASATSAPTAVVAGNAPVDTALPVVSGTARDAQTLTATQGTWTGSTPIAYAYQWRRCDSTGGSCADIAGATTASYTLTGADVGATIRVAVTATNAAGAATAGSAATATVAAAPPAVTTLPTISGTARDGSTLAADRGAWTGTPTIAYAYQWRRCDAAGANCADIAGATASTYTVTGADVGKTIRVAVTATNAGGSTTAASAATGTAAPVAPVNTAAPAIGGTTRDGSTVTVSQGTWTGTAPIAYAYQWRRCDATGSGCADIAGATGAMYALTGADVGKTIRAVVTASNAAGSTAAATAATAVVDPLAPSSTTAPSISGATSDGSTLTATTGTWSGTAPIAYAYQWQRCDAAGDGCVDIGDATGGTYALTSDDVAATIRVRVTATNAAGSASRVSAATAAIAATAPVNSADPSISGTARDGQLLTSSRGTWTGTTPIAYTYRWERCDAAGAGCGDIAGATGSTYLLTSVDAGHTVRVRVTAANSAGSASVESPATGLVAAMAPTVSTPPAITGSRVDGGVLTVDSGTWNGTTPISYAYQWQRCAADGSACANVAGATATTYALTAADVDHAVRAIVTATNAAGSASAASATVGPIDPAAPANATAPAVSGSAVDGATLTATDGTWTGTAPIAYAHRWQRCDTTGGGCADIAGATASTYTLTAADVGHTVRDRVTATNAGGSATASSAATPVVAAAAPASVAPPVVSGSAVDGATLTATNGTWTGTAPIAYAHQWQRCDASGANCVDIAGATSSTYTLTSADVGRTVRDRVTATNAGGSATRDSQPTAAVSAAGPVNVTAPSISGTARDGATLTVDRGNWTGTPTITYAYRWQRCDATGNGCVDLADATSTAYTLTSADVDHTIAAVVTATNAGGTQSRAAAPTALVVAAAPAVTSAPAIGGQARDGQTLTADHGTWSGTTPITYAYQWQRCDGDGSSCSDIAGAAAATYQLTSAAGATVRVAVTARNVAGSASQTSAPTATVEANAPANTALPAVTGTTRDGQTLTAAPGAWSGTTPIAYAYRWQRCDADGTHCADIAGATGATYDLTSSDVGHAIRVVVTASNAAGSDSATSAPTAGVTAQAPISLAAPTVGGTARDGAMLTADRGTWSGTPTISYAYQWQRCGSTGTGCADIAGATGSTYDLAGADVGATIRVAVTASNAGGSTTRTSDPTAVVVAAGPANVTLPATSGTERDGSTLTAGHGDWSGTAPITYAYQWQRCDAAGGSCADVAGATAATYALTGADVGARMRVAVTATNAAGASTATSAPTGSIGALAPTMSTAPAISGPARDGATLTADHGTWTGTAPIAYAYQWQRCDATGAGCADISGADRDAYEQTSADVGHALRVQVTATNAGGSADVVSSATAPVAAVAPTNTALPTIAGTPRTGQTLHAGHGAWDGTVPMSYGYQWQRCASDGSGCSDIAGETVNDYALTDADLGHAVRVVVTASNVAGSAARASDPTAAVTGAPAALTPPRLSGTAQDGSTLTADHGTWSGDPTSYAYQWQRCAADGSGCVDLPGATADSYTLTADDVGHAVRVVVTAANADGTGTASATSAAVTAAPSSAPTTPTTPGAPAAGQGSPPTPAQATPDLATLPGSLVSDRACQTVTGGRATRRATLHGTGAVFLRVRADTVVAPDSPIVVTVTTPRGRTVAVRATLDGRALALRPGSPRTTSIAPALLGLPGTHVLVAKATARGRTRTLRLRVRSALCAARYTARQGRRTAAGTATVRLRIDSRTALTALNLPLPAALRLRAGAKPRRAARLRVVVAGGQSRIYALTLPPARRSGAFAVTPSGPRVTFGASGLELSALPAGTGIVELTETGVQGVAPGRTVRLRARASGAAGRRTLTAKLLGPRP